jgi:hypothetical protein
LALFQVLIGLPILGVAAAIGRDHLDQAMLAAAVVWPLVLLSYGPLLLANTPSILVPMYLGMMIRMFGTTASVVAMRQIAAPLAPDSWFIYISAFYLAGLAAETSWVVASLKRCPKLPKIERKA